MARTLLVGRAGSGKTRRLLEALHDRVRAGTDGRALLLVPTYGRGEHLKRELLRLDGGLDGFFDRSILTFTALAERVLGGTRIGALVSGTMRDHLLREALDAALAPAFEPVKGFPGFRAALLGFLKEAKESGLPFREVQSAFEELARTAGDPAARRRMDGVAKVHLSYAAYLRREGLLDHEDFLRALLEGLREPGGLPASLGSPQWLGVDGFHDFTRVERDVLEELAARVPEVVLTLPDDGDPARADLFVPSRETRAHFEAKRWHVERLGEFRRPAARGGDLARMESALFRPTDVPEAPPDGTVRVLRCADAADEADRFARTAALWIRRDGWKPYEVLVVYRSLASARGPLEEAFERHGVPLRAAGPRPLAAEPVVRAALDLARLALGCADGETALRALRSSYAARADRLDGDALAIVIAERGVPLEAGGVLEIAEEIPLAGAARLLQRLLPRETQATKMPPEEIRRTVLEGLEVPARLLPAYLPRPGGGGGEDDARGAVEAAALRALLGLLGETTSAMRIRERARVAPTDFLDEWEQAAGRATFAVPDRRLHAVNAVPVEEARQWEARGVLVGGLVEKEFPRAPREDLFLRDADRRAARAAGGLSFAERLRERDEERYLFYVAATRARERLVLSYPAAGPEGERRLPSSFLEEVERIWPAEDRRRPPAFSESFASDPYPAPGEALGEGDLLRRGLLLSAEPVPPAGAAFERAREAGAVLDALAARRGRRGMEEVARAALLSSPAVPALRDARLRRGLLRPFRTSASALDAFHQCPYLHFARQLLGLRPVESVADEGLTPLLLGNIVHETLRRWMQRGTREDAVAIFDEVFAEEAAGVRRGVDSLALRERARDAIYGFAELERARIAGRPFQPRWFERAFPGEPATGPLVLRAGGRRIEVRGRFDRVDVDPRYGAAVVVDYKYSSRVEKTYGPREHAAALEGEDPQVPIYLLAARDAAGVVPLGVEIADVRSGRVTGIRLEGAPETVAPDTRVPPLAAADLEELERRVSALAGGAAEALAAGDVGTRPADLQRCGAGRCDFADLCRFEKWNLPRRRREEGR